MLCNDTDNYNLPTSTDTRFYFYKNDYVKGTTTDQGSTSITMADYCKDANTLNELFCDRVRGSINNEEHSCQYGCRDGVCRQPITVRVVSLSGNGQNLMARINYSAPDMFPYSADLEYGTSVNYTFSRQLFLTSTPTTTPSPFDYNWYINNYNNETYHFRIILDRGRPTQLASADHTVYSSICKYYQDMYKIKYYTTTSCANINGLKKDSYCVGNVLHYIFCDPSSTVHPGNQPGIDYINCAREEIFECHYGCAGTSCIEPPENVCWDSDPSDNPEIKGQLEKNESSYPAEAVVDSCWSQNYTNEYHCKNVNGKNISEWQLKPCPVGKICSQGVCI
jgi:hypothetical protein